MAKRKSPERQNGSSSKFEGLKNFFTSNATHFIAGLIILVITVYAFISLLSFFSTGAADQSKIEGLSFFHFGSVEGITNWMGMRGAILSDMLMNKGFGISTFFLLLFLFFVGLRLMKAKYVSLLRYFIICAVLTIWTSVTVSLIFGSFFKATAFYIGGAHGFVLSELMVKNFGIPGSIMIIIVVLLIILVMISSRTIPFIQKLFKWKPKGPKEPKEGNGKTDKGDKGDNEGVDSNYEIPKPLVEIKKPPVSIEKPVINNTPKGSNPEIEFQVNVPSPDDEVERPQLKNPHSETSPSKIIVQEDENGYDALAELGEYDPTLDLSSYKTPTLDLLKRYEQRDTQVDMAEQNENKNKIIQTLENFGINIKSIKATVGPTVTLYEIVQEDGVRISKIRNLEDDIAMKLAALGIRIIAPMPGKGTVGIEVPNKDPQIVSMHSIIASRKFQESTFDLPIAL